MCVSQKFSDAKNLLSKSKIIIPIIYVYYKFQGVY